MTAEALAALTIALGAGWASGLNTYATILVLGGAQQLGLVSLPHDLQVLASPCVMNDTDTMYNSGAMAIAAQAMSRPLMMALAIRGLMPVLPASTGEASWR